MAVIEIVTFRLRDTNDQDAFLEADRGAQTEIAYRQPGLMRRTTARDDQGRWAVVTLWASAADAVTGANAVWPAIEPFVDTATVSTDRFSALD